MPESEPFYFLSAVILKSVSRFRIFNLKAAFWLAVSKYPFKVKAIFSVHPTWIQRNVMSALEEMFSPFLERLNISHCSSPFGSPHPIGCVLCRIWGMQFSMAGKATDGANWTWWPKQLNLEYWASVPFWTMELEAMEDMTPGKRPHE